MKKITTARPNETDEHTNFELRIILIHLKKKTLLYKGYEKHTSGMTSGWPGEIEILTSVPLPLAEVQ